jgi:hypothetical protein
MNRTLDQERFMVLPEGVGAREMMGGIMRMQLQKLVGDAQCLTDAELSDSFYYTLFPNFHPWGAYNRIIYRFRPWGNVPDECLMEVIYLAPYRGQRPKPAPIHWLDFDDDWCDAGELGFLARVFNQDTYNLPNVQKGLKANPDGKAYFAQYQETKIRHFHKLLENYLDL